MGIDSLEEPLVMIFFELVKYRPINPSGSRTSAELTVGWASRKIVGFVQHSISVVARSLSSKASRKTQTELLMALSCH
jgi:hypothetical protein